MEVVIVPDDHFRILFLEMDDPDLYNRLSYLFGTEKQHRIRKFSVICRERLKNTFLPIENTQVVLSGSTSDGVAYPPSDDDTMVVRTFPDLFVRSYVEVAVQYNAPLMIPSDTSPGYCLLWIPDVDRHPYIEICVNGYFSSLAWKKRCLIPGHSLHGPCSSGFYGEIEVDFAACLALSNWPGIANEWIQRERHFGWPPRSVVQQIISNGCHVVPIGDPDSAMSDHQWRLSFSLAERTLIHTFNHIQFLVYNVLKLVLKRIINIHEPDCICSYFIKTTMFYCIENTASTMWDKDQLELCYSKCLALLSNFVDGMFCPNYFVKENNMFKRKINPNNRPRVISLLQWLIHLGIPGALYHTEKRRIIDMHVTVTLSEVKSDVVILTGYHLRMLISEIERCIFYLSNQSSFNIPAYDTMIRIVVDTVEIYLMSEDARYITLLLLRYSSTLMAGYLQSQSRALVIENKHLHKIKMLIKKLYERGTQYDVSCGRLRYATHLYTENDVDKCLKLIQETMSAIAPYVLMDGCRVDDDSLSIYEKALCDRNVSITEKSKQGFAHVVEFHPWERLINPGPISILMCFGKTVGCSREACIDPIMYAHFLQGLCFFKLQNQTGLRNSVDMLKERLKTNNFNESGIYNQVSIEYSLLGRLELLQDKLRESIGHFVKSYLFRENYKNRKGNEYLQSEKINYALLNLGIACNHGINNGLHNS